MKLSEFANRKLELMIEQPDGWRETLIHLESVWPTMPADAWDRKQKRCGGEEEGW